MRGLSRAKCLGTRQNCERPSAKIDRPPAELYLALCAPCARVFGLHVDVIPTSGDRRELNEILAIRASMHCRSYSVGPLSRIQKALAIGSRAPYIPQSAGRAWRWIT